MKGPADIIIAVADLVEAEARNLRGEFYRRGIALALIALVASLLIGGAAFLFWALDHKLAEMAGEVNGAVYTALIMFVFAGGTLWVTKKSVL